MKKFLIILYLFPLFIVNCRNVQPPSIDFDNFNNHKINEIVFCTLNTIGEYSYMDSFPESEEIYKLIEERSNNLSTDSLVIKINNEILDNTSMTIIDSIKCVGYQRYEDIVKKCFDNWDNPENISLITKFKNVGIINYYNKVTNTVYIVCVLK